MWVAEDSRYYSHLTQIQKVEYYNVVIRITLETAGVSGFEDDDPVWVHERFDRLLGDLQFKLMADMLQLGIDLAGGRNR